MQIVYAYSMPAYYEARIDSGNLPWLKIGETKKSKADIRIRQQDKETNAEQPDKKGEWKTSARDDDVRAALKQMGFEEVRPGTRREWIACTIEDVEAAIRVVEEGRLLPPTPKEKKPWRMNRRSSEADTGLPPARIFRPAGSQPEKCVTRDCVQIHGPDGGAIHMHIVSAYPLGVREEDVLLVILSLTKPEDIILSISETHQHVLEEMIVRQLKLPGDFYKIKTTGSEIKEKLECSGFVDENLDLYGQIVDPISKLAFVSFDGKNSRSRLPFMACQLLHCKIDEKPASIDIDIIVNERAAWLVLGAYDDGKHKTTSKDWLSRLSIAERFALKSDAAKIIHRIASFTIKTEKSYDISSLTDQVYGNDEMDEAMRQDWMTSVRRGLEEISKLPGWSVTFDEAYVTVTMRKP